MSTYKRKPSFFDTDEGVAFEQKLKIMEDDPRYATASSYSANSELYPNNKRPFVATHIDYFRAHPTIDPEHYLANLRLQTRVI